MIEDPFVVLGGPDRQGAGAIAQHEERDFRAHQAFLDHEPVAYIVGEKEFFGLPFRVTRDTLIPRPETELLAEAGWGFLATLAPGQCHALDLGTGSGCLAIALAVKCPAVQVVATDLSAAALAVAFSIALMHATKTLHPPGGATALIAVISGPQVTNLGYLYALIPVGAGALVMLAVALLVNNLAPRRRYPEFWW